MSWSDLFTSGLPLWYEFLFNFGSYLTGLFLLVLAGLAFRQLYQRPREIRWFLGAIGLTLFNIWGLNRIHSLSYTVLSLMGMGGMFAGFGYLVVSLVFTVLGLIIVILVWCCLLQAVFGASQADSLHPDEEPSP